jgi:uncharacterized protein (TIGR00725 family)
LQQKGWLEVRSSYQICVSGAAKGDSVEQGKKLVEEAATAIAKAGHGLLTGATTGLPEYAAKAYVKAGGKVSLGISPAGTKVEHILKYHLPTDAYDAILYTGLHYVGRDALLINSADAVVSVGGRWGTMHEFAIALETQTPVALLQGAGGASAEIEKLLDILPLAHRKLIIIDTDPDKLVAKLTALLDKLHAPYRKIYSN